ncbi:MAG: hypothetical protein Q9220_001754 [cf. Caloplaca sp. 1 TL-2023]
MKRKAEKELSEQSVKRTSLQASNGPGRFRDGLLQQIPHYHEKYTQSQPYKHGVIESLVEPQLLRDVRAEIQANLSFTPKETDIYKIHQSGDLANLDGLDDSSLKLLPSLLLLRDALYSSAFRDFLSKVTASGPLSGEKTDMAINVYTPGCHLLCHDDVIGSRRVSYILYLTDPDRPWKPEWGGALRLYPTQIHKDAQGKEIKVPSPDHTVSIPPAFNQLSFFAVQPGESFHDVEEVFASQSSIQGDGDEARVRMAISGWYHIPQQGEDGYIEGLEESLAERSSLQQLQGDADQYDMPQPQIIPYGETQEEEEEEGKEEEEEEEEDDDETLLSEKDLDFLLHYIAPTYLTPDTLESISGTFENECSICLEKFLSPKFADALKTEIAKEEAVILPLESSAIEDETSWQVARPPHKHRFLYQQGFKFDPQDLQAQGWVVTPITRLLNLLFPSKIFRKWLRLATGLTITSHNLLARRFRRGKDYTLATGYHGEESQLEIILAMTPSPGWVNADDTKNKAPDNIKQEGIAITEHPPHDHKLADETSGPGGYIAYMASDDADDDGSTSGIEVPLDMSTGARASKPSKADPAIYTPSPDDDDGILFSMPPDWNTLGIVLRDAGVMRFVKYVSKQARGDRWDILGEYGVGAKEDEDEEEEDGEGGMGFNGSGGDEEETETEIESSEGD